MALIKGKITNWRITNCTVAMDVQTEGELCLQVDREAKINPPINPNDHTALFLLRVHVITKDTDEINIDVQGEFVFEFEEIPTDYNQVARHVCIDIAENEIFTLIDRVLQDMNYPALDLLGKKLQK